MLDIKICSSLTSFQFFKGSCKTLFSQMYHTHKGLELLYLN